MRVLLTGCTNRQVRPQDNADALYFTVFTGLSRCLIAAGVELDWRAVEPGEELKGRYDAALVGIHSFGSLSSKEHKWGAAWAMSQLPHLPVFEDWRVRDVTQHMKNTGNFWNLNMVVPGSKADKMFQLASKPGTVEPMVKAISLMSCKLDGALLPAMNWCDLDAFQRFHKVMRPMGWDINPFYDEQPGLPAKAKERKWSMISLTAQDKALAQLAPSWPVTSIYKPEGAKGVGGVLNPGMRPSSWGFMPEKELVEKVYRTHRGMFLPAYGKKGVRGWWRNRWWLSAKAGCVLRTEPSDAPASTDIFSLPVDEIEEMKDDELDSLADAQHEFTMSYHLSKQDSAAHMRLMLQELNAPCGS